MEQEQTQARHVAAATKKAAIRLLPFLMLMYALAFIDRANVGFAKVAYQADTGLSDASFAFGAGIFFVGYALFEVPSNLIMMRVGARIWMSRIMVTWGVLSALMMCAHTPNLFYLIRFFLGVAEAGFFPGIIVYLTYWFPAARRARALGLFYFGVPIAMLIGNPLSGFLLEMHGVFGLRNWQWMYLVEGVMAMLVGVVAFFYLASRPDDARWLSDDEKRALGNVIAAEEREKPQHLATAVFAVLKDRRVLTFIAAYFCIQIGNAPLAFYLPSKFAATMGGQMNGKIGLLLAIPWLCTILAMFVATRIADRRRNHLKVATLMLTAGILAFAALSVIDTPVLTLLAFCIAIPGLVACQPVFWYLPTRYLGGTGAASGIAFIVSIGNLGGFVSPQIKALTDHYSGGTQVGFLVIAAVCFLSVVLLHSLRSSRSDEMGDAPHEARLGASR
jgi:MFS family permease